MNSQSSLRFAVALLFAAFVVAALALADFGVRAQNTNTSNTGEESAQNANANANTTRRGRGRRGRRGAANTNADADANANANTGDATATTPAGNVNTGAATQEEDDDTPRDLSGERVDLSGTYNGNLSTTGGQDVGSGPATLTINGSTFTLTTEGGATHSGSIYAVLTRGATSAALYFTNLQDPATRTPVVYNVRARKSGDRLMLSPAPNTSAKLTFAPAGRRGRG